MGTMSEREIFSRRFEGAEPDRLWAALKRALATRDLKDTDDAARVARFSTGVSVWSWGQHMLASVSASDSGGSVLTVRGRPKASLLTTGWGERRDGRKAEKQLLSDVEAALGDR